MTSQALGILYCTNGRGDEQNLLVRCTMYDAELYVLDNREEGYWPEGYDAIWHNLENDQESIFLDEERGWISTVVEE